MTDRDLEEKLHLAILLLRSAFNNGKTTYLKGCTNYIISMKPDDLEV